MLVPSKGNLRVTARSLVPLMDVSDRVTRLECSAPRERRYATKARSPVSRPPFEAGRRVCEAVGPGPPASARWSPVLRSRFHPLIGVERIGLETDLVRRPRVRGTAPLATVGKERRLFYFENAFIGGVLFTPRWSRFFLLKQVVVGLVPSSAVYLVDPASSHMLVSKIKPCKCQHMPPNG